MRFGYDNAFGWIWKNQKKLEKLVRDNNVL